MLLLGTVTSPYVRRVRVVARALGLPVTLLDTRSPEGAAELRRLSPVGKVPVAVFDDGRVVWDSAVINRALTRIHGWGSLRPSGPTLDHQLLDHQLLDDQLMVGIDGALDAAINRFYLRAPGEPLLDDHPYVEKQQQRVITAMAWVEQQLDDQGRLAGRPGLGLPEIALVSALGWMRFRATFPVDEHPPLAAFLDRHERDARIEGTGPR
ncbi:MAG: glutathione S-transferase family protein [Deltaproteobacteria bacterium]|nr:glutathione S-transferase family protein [Deltaproteobacteria bacterium]